MRMAMDEEEDLTGPEALAYRSFGNEFPVLMVLVDPDMCISWASPGSMPVLGYQPDELVGLSVLELLHPDDLASIAELLGNAAVHPAETLSSPAAARLVEFPVRARCAAGTWEPMSASGRVLDSDGTLLGVIRSAREVHALDMVIGGLGARGDLDSVLAAVLDLACSQFRVPSAWIIHDADGSAEVVGTDDPEVLQRTPHMLGDLRGAGLSADVIARGGTWSVPILSATGETLFGILQLSERRPGGPAPLDVHLLARVASLASIAFARHRDDQLLTEAATTDYLTGLANRRQFERRLAETSLVVEETPLTLLYVDVDDFKAVNDSLGHKVGDEVLAVVARRLAGEVRSCDFVGRLGGDEFAVGVLGLDRVEAASLAARLGQTLAEPITVGCSSIAVTASIGIARAFDEDSLETILERGDDDMFLRKRSRRSELQRSRPNSPTDPAQIG